jgi:hypothetical protein
MKLRLQPFILLQLTVFHTNINADLEATGNKILFHVLMFDKIYFKIMKVKSEME